MLDKRAITRQFLKELGLETKKANFDKYYAIWWMNIRADNTHSSFRITEAGYKTFTEKLGLTSYNIPLKDGIVFSSRLLLDLDKYLDCPFYMSTKEFFVLREITAVELILYEGDLPKYITAKKMSQKYNISTP